MIGGSRLAFRAADRNRAAVQQGLMEIQRTPCPSVALPQAVGAALGSLTLTEQQGVTAIEKKEGGKAVLHYSFRGLVEKPGHCHDRGVHGDR